ncbi:unnamed protein product [Vicia faba]|uniref:Uncharacterized protein n=1 Tax=Vicia faba TaxID=3906 RepID=A0AAV1AJA7_VICFA|nr:unnamed protein product [Vicia faba]
MLQTHICILILESKKNLRIYFPFLYKPKPLNPLFSFKLLTNHIHGNYFSQTLTTSALPNDYGRFHHQPPQQPSERNFINNFNHINGTTVSKPSDPFTVSPNPLWKTANKTLGGAISLSIFDEEEDDEPVSDSNSNDGGGIVKKGSDSIGSVGITLTAQDGSRLFFVERPAGLGSSLQTGKPAVRSIRPNLFAPSMSRADLDQGGTAGDSDIEMTDLSDSDGEEGEDEYDRLFPFKPLKKSQIAKLKGEQKRACLEEYDYRVKLLQKKQWREELKRMRERNMITVQVTKDKISTFTWIHWLLLNMELHLIQ